MNYDPHRMPYHPPRCRAKASHSGVTPWLLVGIFVAFGCFLWLAGCASHYIAADKDMSRMSAAQLTLELSKP